MNTDTEVGEILRQEMKMNHVPYRDRILLHSWNCTHCQTAVTVLCQRQVENCARFSWCSTQLTLILEEKIICYELQSGRNGVQMFNRNMAQLSTSQCFKSTLVYIIMCITEERAPYSPTFLTDG